MSDRKTLATVLGATIGVAAVAAAVGVYVCRHREAETQDVNAVFEKARRSVQKLNEAVEALRQSAA